MITGYNPGLTIITAALGVAFAATGFEIRKIARPTHRKWMWFLLPLAGMLASLAYFAMLIMAEGVNRGWAFDLPCFGLIGAVVGAITTLLFRARHFAAVMLRRAIIGAVLGLLILFPFVAWRAMTVGIPRPSFPVMHGGPSPINDLFFVPFTCVLSVVGGGLGAFSFLIYSARDH